MYYIAFRNLDGTYSIDDVVTEWFETISNYEPIDCVNEEVLIYDDKGNKYAIGPNKLTNYENIVGNISVVDVGAWDIDNNEPFLIDLETKNKPELSKMLAIYEQQK